MVVNVDKTKDKVIGNGTSGPYPFTGIKLINPEKDLLVYIEDSDGNTGEALIVNIDYLITYSETNTTATFEIELLNDVTIPNTEALFVNRSTPLDQGIELTRSGEINTKKYEGMNDKVVLQNQDQNSLINSTFKLKANVTDPVDLELDSPAGNEGKAVVVNDTGDGLRYSNSSITEIEESIDDLDEAVAAAEASAIAAAGSESNAAESEENAAESAEIAKESFKGDWADDYVDPISGLDGYTQGNTVVFGANQWWSKTDENTSVPPLEYNTPSTEWEHYLRGAITNDEFVADVQEALILGDSVEDTFDLTAINASFRPTNINQIFAVTIDTVMISEEEYTITIDGVTGHSLIMFTTPPPIPVDPDGTYNVIVKGATPNILKLSGETGDEKYTMLSTAPTGWLFEEGQELSRTTYADLWNWADTNGLVNTEVDWQSGEYGLFSDGDGSTTFRIPDARGQFIRVQDNGAGIDPDAGARAGADTNGSVQGFAMENLVGDVTSLNLGRDVNISTTGCMTGVSSGISGTTSSGTGLKIGIDASLTNQTSTETRPVNINRKLMIKY